MEIVLETIRYIRQLEDQLIDRFPADAVLDHSALSGTHTDTPPPAVVHRLSPF